MTEVEANRRGEGFPEKAEYERIRKQGRERLLLLSKPKEVKKEWYTNVGPDVSWGTQEMLWPVTKTAKQAEASRRVRELATPKRNFQDETNNINVPLYYYSCGRSSTIFDVPDGAKKASASARIEQLAQPKSDVCNHKDDIAQFVYSCGRSSPITAAPPVQSAERPRTNQLATHKNPHPEFEPSKEIQTIVSTAAMKASASERIEGLANPKNRPVGPFREPEWLVSDSAKNAAASTRSVELARAKPLAEGYQPHKEIEWPISKGAKRAQATPRVNELSQPVVRASMDHLQFNPDAFVVKASALKGICPKRVDELAQPIQR
ncbi:hypothetical protein LOTGIDRAFT_214487 [Lottia gigantea]|uniref:Uncharacterized protein n=1 Tax=Lottia gigantea TaxID=225164 RepID=V4C5S5_LOTGI|nr:hypothetical protein LOTGIDRAFT_214487 [Lottia gigantea]ESO96959.1 hypothetical protein LOTGIDRAFT_214487 [Lottia gigantea]